MRKLWTIVIAIGAISFHVRADDWPQLLGPDRSGTVDEADWNSDWPESGPPVLWRADIGYGAAPVVVVDGRVYGFGVTELDVPVPPYDATTGTIGGEAVPQQNMEDGVVMQRTDAYCLAADTGKVLWRTTISAQTWSLPKLYFNMASPLYSNGHVYFHTFDGKLACLRAADGLVVWSVDLAEHGMATREQKGGNWSSPLLVPGRDAVVVAYRGREGAADFGREGREGFHNLYLAAFDARTGARRWRSALLPGGHRPAYSSPNYGVVDGAPAVVISTGLGCFGIDPATGTARWDYEIGSGPADGELFPEFAAFLQGKVPANQEGMTAQAALRLCFTNRMPQVTPGGIVLDQTCGEHCNPMSRTFGYRVRGGEVEMLWSTPWANCHWNTFQVRDDGRLLAVDLPGYSWFKRGTELSQRVRGYRPADIKQFQCIDAETGKLLWSSQAISTTWEIRGQQRADRGEGNPEINPLGEEGCGVYGGAVQYIKAGDRIIANWRGGLRVGRILPEGGLRLEAAYNVGPGYPTQPVLSDGLLYIRKHMAGRSRFGGEPGDALVCFDLSPM